MDDNAARIIGLRLLHSPKMLVVRDSTIASLLLFCISCGGATPAPIPETTTERVNYQSLGDDRADVVERDLSGPALFDECRGAQVAPGTFNYACPDDYRVRVTAMPKDMAVDAASHLEAAPNKKARDVRLRLGERLSEGVAYEMVEEEESQSKKLSLYFGLVTTAPFSDDKLYIECLRKRPPDDDEAFGRCPDYLGSYVAKLSGPHSVETAAFPGGPLALPDGCIQEDVTMIRCGRDKLDWYANNDKELLKTALTQQRQRVLRARDDESNSRVVSVRNFPCEVRGATAECREMLLKFDFRDGGHDRSSPTPRV